MTGDRAGEAGTLTELSEEVIVAEAQVVATRVVQWFRERLRIAEHERDVADQRRMTAEDSQRTTERQRNDAQRRVVEVEELIAASDELAQQLQQALDSRIVIEQAKGFLTGRHGVTPDAAFEAMRRYARSNRLPLHTVARDLMAGTPPLRSRGGTERPSGADTSGLMAR